MPPVRTLFWAGLLALAGCGEPAFLFGGTGTTNDDEAKPRLIINGGTSSGAWADEDTQAVTQPGTSDPATESEAPGALEPPPAEEPAPAAEPPAAEPAPAEPEDSCGDAFETEVLDLVNAERARYGKAPLRCDAGTSRVASDFSDYMCEAHFFSHVAPDGSTPVSRLTAAGLAFLGAGENIAAGQKSPSEVMASWMSSSGHRANILGTFTHLGVGYTACAKSYYHYWTQSFIRR